MGAAVDAGHWPLATWSPNLSLLSIIHADSIAVDSLRFYFAKEADADAFRKLATQGQEQDA